MMDIWIGWLENGVGEIDAVLQTEIDRLREELRSLQQRNDELKELIPTDLSSKLTRDLSFLPSIPCDSVRNRYRYLLN